MEEFDSRQERERAMAGGGEIEGEVHLDVPRELLEVIRAGVEAHREVPGSVAVGGSVCALYCHHRLSVDIDFLLPDLATRFQEVRDHLFQVPGWKEARAKRPVLILGSLDGVEVGYRQMRRPSPLETQEVTLPEGSLTIPTVEELLRVKAFLLYDRNYTRDFVDFAELSCLRPTGRVAEALESLDEKFAWEKQPSVVLEVMKSLLSPEPHDGATHGFGTLKLLHPTLPSWEEVSKKCQDVGRALAIRVLGREAP